MRRIERGVTRGQPISVTVDGAMVPVYPGETAAVAVLASGSLRMRDDRSGAGRGMFCNMGTCSECTVWVLRPDRPDEQWVRRRACLLPVEQGMEIRTTAPEAGR